MRARPGPYSQLSGPERRISLLGVAGQDGPAAPSSSVTGDVSVTRGKTFPLELDQFPMFGVMEGIVLKGEGASHFHNGTFHEEG